jgi:uncharacterized membrane-anchored protein
MFFKTLKLFILVILVCGVAAWVSNNGGSVSVEWLGYRVSTSVPFAAISAFAAFWIFGRIFGLMGLLRHPFGGRKKPRDDDSPA